MTGAPTATAFGTVMGDWLQPGPWQDVAGAGLNGWTIYARIGRTF